MTNFLALTMQELVAYYNAHAAAPVKRFADRKTAERRCAALAVTPVTIDPVETPITAALVAEQAVDHSASNARIGKMLAATNGAVAGPRPAMSQSLKLDRRITCVGTGAEYANACQVWKAGLVSAAQGDRLSSLLYGAAKRGEFNTVAVNGHSFKLTVGGAA